MKSITNLAFRNNCRNKSRSILIMIAIILSTIIMTAISAYGYGLVGYSKASADVTYGSFYGMFTQLTPEQQKNVQHRSEFTDIGKLADLGEVNTEDRVEIIYVDEISRKLSNVDVRIEEGNFPAKENELLASPTMLKRIGYPGAKVGDRINLSFRKDLKSEFHNIEFVISGIQKEGEGADISKKFVCFVSKAFFDKYYDEKTYEFDLLFRLDESIKMNSDNATEIIDDLAEKCGIEEEKIFYNSTYLLMILDPGKETLSVCAVLILGVILFSMIVIYNIFQVGLVQQIQEYGRIKALGTTRKQMKKLINREGMMLALPSVPIGAIIGYVISYFSFNWITAKSSVVNGLQTVSDFKFFSPVVFAICIVLGLITVWIALIKPKRTVAKLSAVEAAKFREGRKKKKGSFRKGRKTVTGFGLVLADIASSKKRTAITIITMGLSCVLFVIFANLLGNIDNDFEARKQVEYGQFEIDMDFTFYDEAYPENNLDNILADNPINEEFIEKVKNIEGVTGVSTRNFLVYKNGVQYDSIEVLSREAFDKSLKRGGILGDFDYDSVTEKGEILYGWSRWLESIGFSVGDELKIDIWDGNEWKEMDSVIAGAFGAAGAGWILTEDTYKSLEFEKTISPGVLWVDCEEKDIEKIRQELDNIISNTNHLEMTSYKDAMKECNFSTKIIKSGIYILLVIIGLIGFINLINTMVINISVKRHEYGILQAVGMTNRQLGRNLRNQGLLFIIGTLIISLGVGLPLGYATFKFCKSRSYFGINIYHFPVKEIFIMSVALIVMQLVLSYVLSRNLKRESLIERIRHTG